jgi:hypothetical protein
MVISDLDEVTFDLEVDGEQVRKQVSRRVWERGGWATIACAYEERGASGEWKSKVALLRFRKEHEVWKRLAAITLQGSEALELAETLVAWSRPVVD